MARRLQPGPVLSPVCGSPHAATRRGLLKYGPPALLGAAVLAGCGKRKQNRDAGAVTATQLEWIKDTEWAGVYVAEKQGFFADEGISSQLLGGGPNATTVPQAVSGGAAQFGLGQSVGEAAAAVKAGSDLVVLGAIWQRSLNCVISLPGNPVHTLAQLAGRRVATTSPERVRDLFAGAGIPDVTVVRTGGDITPLLEGDVEAYLGFASNQVVTLQSRGIEPVVLSFEQAGFADYLGPIVTSRSLLARNRKRVTGYVRALIKGHELNMREPEFGARLVVDDYAIDQGIDLATALRSNKVYIDYELSDLTRKKGLFWIDLARIEGPIYRSLARTGLTGLPPPESYVDLSVLQEIYGGRSHVLDRTQHA